MELGQIVIAVTVGALALAVLLYLLSVLLKSIVGDGREAFEKLRLRSKEKLLVEADALIKSGNPAKAAMLLREALALDHSKGSVALIERVTNHNLSILSRLLSLCDSRSIHFPNLAVVEELFLSRGQILKGYLEVSELGRGRRKKEGGGQMPGWAIAEYKRRVLESKDKIATNRRSIESQLEDLFRNLEKVSSAQEVTYH